MKKFTTAVLFVLTCLHGHAQQNPAPKQPAPKPDNYGRLNTAPDKIAQLGPWAAEARRRSYLAANPSAGPKSSTVCRRVHDDMVTCHTY